MLVFCFHYSVFLAQKNQDQIYLVHDVIYYADLLLAGLTHFARYQELKRL